MKTVTFAFAIATAGIAVAQASLAGERASAKVPTPAPDYALGVTVVHAGHLLDHPGRLTRDQVTVVVRDGRIESIREGFVDPASIDPSARRIDLSRAWVLPGLIDSHVHLTMDRAASRPEDATTMEEADVALMAQANAFATLQAGFTTVRNLGGPPAVRSLQRQISLGVVYGPTILNAAQMISVSAGHGDINGLNTELTQFYEPRQTGVCDGADDCRKAVRAQVRAGADVIKLAVTGGVNSNVAGGLGQQMSDAEIKAAIETAHAFGRKAAAHAHGKSGIDAAIRAGVDSIEHGTFTDEGTIRLLKQHGTYLVPTALAPKTVLDLVAEGKMPAPTAAKIRQAVAVFSVSIARAVRGGVKIAFGTDSGVSRHGDNAKEFKLLIDLGMTPIQAITAATVSAADLLGVAARVGSIEAGKDADLVAVDQDPRTDVTTLERMQFVMRHGTVHRSAGKPVYPEVIR